MIYHILLCAIRCFARKAITFTPKMMRSCDPLSRMMTQMLCGEMCVFPWVFEQKSIRQRKKTLSLDKVFSCGGEGGNRTLAPVSQPTPLAGEPLHRLSTSPQ